MRLRRSFLAVLMVVLVGCVTTSRPTTTPTASTPSPAASSAAPVDSPEPSVTIAPTDVPVATPSPTASPTESPSGPSPSASAGSGAAAECSGSDKNREFFEAAAVALDWTVYCATLPAGWSVDSGEYRQAGGGRLEIAYRGPARARFELHEGAFCATGSGCVPSGIEAGDAPFGDQAGTLIATDDGGWALVVDRDAALSWLAVGTGIDEDDFRALTTALTAVSG